MDGSVEPRFDRTIPAPLRRAARRLASIASPTVVALLAFALCYGAGQRGFFMTDQSFVFDGGYRVYCGQVPYRDFLVPWGPVALWIQAAAFAAGGVDFASYLTTAAVENSLGALLAFQLLRRLFPGSPGLALAAGVMTAAWYYAPFGTPWLEQTGFLFTFVGLNCLTLTLRDPPGQTSRGALLAIAATGGCTVLTFLSKQNAGVFMPGVYLALLGAMFLPKWRALGRAVGAYFGGVALASAAFAVWLASASDPAEFYRSVWVIPASEGGRRLFAQPLEMAEVLLTGKGPEFPRMLLWAGALVGAGVLWRGGLAARTGRASSALRFAAMLCVVLSAYQNAFNKTTEQSGNNGMPYVGLVVACAVGVVVSLRVTATQRATSTLEWFTLPQRLAALAAAAVASLVCMNGVPIGGTACAVLLGHAAGLYPWPSWRLTAWMRRLPLAGSRHLVPLTLLFAASYLTLHGGAIAWRRQTLHIFGPECEFPRRLAVPGLEPLKWGVPTRAHSGRVVTEQDLAELIEYLAAGKRRFFVFPDFALLYGVVGAESPQPLVWFDEGLTYPSEYDPRLDQRIVRELAEHQVDTLVLESATSFEPEAILSDFPQVAAYLRAHFAPARMIGSFEIRERRPALAETQPEQQAKLR
ncbi:MAG: hypothetical protein JNG90_09530 [Planctomycetaceae bacterium]|nr:hypothetical protein [Planctomycetaceae bacterium]